MFKVIEILKNVAPTDSTVLIHGESGTGKELVARALHQNSPRKNKPLVPLNISALPSSILESELFGHEAGAFTGAIGKRIGKFEYANGGTLFLDEVGEMPMETQIKLLRVLEDHKITRVGANEEIEVNVRVVAATNADLKELVEARRFRNDLYQRLNVVSIYLPPLRERRSDIPLLMDHFRKELCDRNSKQVIGFSKLAQQALLMYDWPGNIRQLRNTIERMLVLDTDGLLDVDDLPDEIAVLVRDGTDGRPPDGFFGADTARRPTLGGGRKILHPPRSRSDRRQARGGSSHPGHRRTDAVPQDQGIRVEGVTPAIETFARCYSSIVHTRLRHTGIVPTRRCW